MDPKAEMDPEKKKTASAGNLNADSLMFTA
jgi:hypothetical protein